MPWTRIYTLNLDDLDEAVQRTFELTRRIRTISALREGFPRSEDDLVVVHLNGRINDYPEMTFSQRQYGERTARPDPWYAHLVADISSHPVVFVGTTLDEPPLWQHIELRRSRVQRTRELRPGSYLVTPSIPAARARMLQDFNIQLVEMTQEDFASQVLAEMKAERERGLQAISARRPIGVSRRLLISVAELRSELDDSPGEFLLGRQPTWADIVIGTAVKREFEADLKAKIEKDHVPLVILTGTAGSGKSTTLMRLALMYHAEGKDVFWLESESELMIWQIKNAVQESSTQVLVIDDADVFGSSTGPLLASLVSESPELLLIVAIRSTRLEGLKVGDYLDDTPHVSFAIPHLEDSDIKLLLDTLTSANRLGALRGLSRSKQIATFREQAGRQLLVAMIQATSNETFEEKIDRECRELGS